jgi:hypothetical protein
MQPIGFAPDERSLVVHHVTKKSAKLNSFVFPNFALSPVAFRSLLEHFNATGISI